MFINRSDKACPAGIAQNHFLVRQENLGLQNALVILDISEGKAPSPVSAQLHVDQCTIHPRIQWVPEDTTLKLYSGDSASHHVDALLNGVILFDLVLPENHQAVLRPLIEPGLYKINCESHLWERAWIYVTPHPYVAITDNRGEFTLADIPAGHYSLSVWHEGWIRDAKDRNGRIEFQPMEEVQSVSVRSGKTTEVLFDNLQPTFFH